MSILATIRSWTTEIGVYHVGSLYREDNFLLYWLVRKVLSKVRISDETAQGLKSLSEKGVVVYALKNKSQLNSLILRELCVRNGIPQPVYCHGINMITWQPFPHVPPRDPVPCVPTNLQKGDPRCRTDRLPERTRAEQEECDHPSWRVRTL